jgi:HD superfamily phosphodiesterase
MKMYDAEAEGGYVPGENASHSIGHFADKLLLIKDRMNTDGGKRLAETRHAFMSEFVQRFMYEVHEECKLESK